MSGNRDVSTPDRPDPDGFHDPDDAPELDDAWFAQADVLKNGELVRLGQLSAEEEAQWSFLQPEVLEALRRTGPGWRSRANDILREVLINRGAEAA
jgi:hypothetical protein